MDIQAEKLSLLQTIINTDDMSLILDVKSFLSDREDDWFDSLDATQQNEISEGLAQAERGELVSHVEVVKLFSKWGLK